jgi:hypothetical protein
MTKRSSSGLDDRLPKCAAILEAQASQIAGQAADEGREELRRELGRLNTELAEVREKSGGLGQQPNKLV